MSGAAASSLPEMLGRLKLTAVRDRLDGLLDEAARRAASSTKAKVSNDIRNPATDDTENPAPPWSC